jgi:hypothetical protein
MNPFWCRGARQPRRTTQRARSKRGYSAAKEHKERMQQLQALNELQALNACLSEGMIADLSR